MGEAAGSPYSIMAPESQSGLAASVDPSQLETDAIADPQVPDAGFSQQDQVEPVADSSVARTDAPKPWKSAPIWIAITAIVFLLCAAGYVIVHLRLRRSQHS